MAIGLLTLNLSVGGLFTPFKSRCGRSNSLDIRTEVIVCWIGVERDNSRVSSAK